MKINKIWVQQYGFNGLMHYKYDVGCVCNEYPTPHHHTNCNVKEKPHLVLDPEEAKLHFNENFGEIPNWYKAILK